MVWFRGTNAVLILGFAAILSCMLGSVYIGFQHLEATRSAWARDNVFREKVQTAFLMREAVRERSFRLTFASTLTDYFDREEQRELFRREAISFLSARTRLLELSITPEEEQALETLMAGILAVRPIIEKAMEQIVEQGKDFGEETQEHLETGLKAQGQIIEGLKKFVTVIEASSLREEAANNKTIAANQRNMITLSSIAVGLALIIGLLLLRREGRLKKRLRRHRDQLAALSVTDPLTDIANRRRLDTFFDLAWHQGTRSGLPLSFLLIDVDFFKAYNDEYGHAQGDDCLIAIAAAIEGEVERSSDLAARFGGEEFACVLPNTGSNGAAAVAENIRKAVADLKMDHSQSSVAPCVTVSIGVATCVPKRSSDPARLLEIADGFLYEAKEKGRNQVVVGACDPGQC